MDNRTTIISGPFFSFYQLLLHNGKKLHTRNDVKINTATIKKKSMHIYNISVKDKEIQLYFGTQSFMGVFTHSPIR